MPTIDWPDNLRPQALQWQLAKAGTQFQSPFNGTLQAVDYVAERWQVSLTLPPAQPIGQVAVLLNTLAGGVNRVRLWHHGTRGAPAGSLRGAPVLGAAAARGNASITLANATGRSALLYGAFATDTNSDGLADGVTSYATGAVATVTQNWGVGSQITTAGGLGTGAGDRAGFRFTNMVPLVAGQPFTVSADMTCSTGTQHAIRMMYYSAGGVYLGSDAYGTWPGATILQSRSITGTPPAGCTQGLLHLYLHSSTPSSASLDVSRVQVEHGTTPSQFAGPATLLAGDMLGCGGHLLQVAADCTATDAGAMTVPVVNRIRGTIAINSPVQWLRPTAEFVLPAMQSSAVHVAEGLQSVGLELLEVW